MLSPFRMVCRDFILPEPASYVFFYAFSNLRNLLYIIYVDGIYLRRNWGGEYENVAILVEIAVNEDGFREVLGAAEGM